MGDQSDATRLDEKSALEVPSALGDNTKSRSDSPLPSSSGNSELGDPAVAEKGLDISTPEPSPRNVHGFKWGFAVASVLASTFLFALDNTIVADVQPAIVERFGAVTKLPWLSVAFLVAAAGTNLVWSVSPTPNAPCL